MARDYSNRPRTEIRRADRAVADERWIRDFLREAPVGYLATSQNGQPYLNSNLFVLDESKRCIYMHTARVGRTNANVRAEDRVCFSASRMGRLLPAETALEFSVEYAGVTAFGRATIIEGDEARHALQLLLDKYAPHLRPGRDYRAISDDELRRTGVFRIDIEEWSAKKKEVDASFPGAFEYTSATKDE